MGSLTRKNPLPSIARSDWLPVLVTAPEAKLLTMPAVVTPVPTCVEPAALEPSIWLNVSAKFTEALLKPTVLTFAMLLAMTFNCCWNCSRALTPESRESSIIFLGLVYFVVCGLKIVTVGAGVSTVTGAAAAGLTEADATGVGMTEVTWLKL